MAEQTRKFGGRVAERRDELKLEQKDLVARMVGLGDKGSNTNQVSRYESGEGPMPREARLDAFAKALETDAADLMAGPLAERKPKGKGDLSELDADAKALRKLTSRVGKLAAEVSALRTAQERLLSRLEPGEDGEEETGS